VLRRDQSHFRQLVGDRLQKIDLFGREFVKRGLLYLAAFARPCETKCVAAR